MLQPTGADRMVQMRFYGNDTWVGVTRTAEEWRERWIEFRQATGGIFNENDGNVVDHKEDNGENHDLGVFYTQLTNMTLH